MPSGVNLISPFLDGPATVTHAGWGDSNTGNYAAVYREGCEVLMMHLRDVVVALGQVVQPRQLLGHCDCTGLCDGTHCHISVRMDTKALALQVQADPVQTYGKWAVNYFRLVVQEDDVSKQDVIDAFREKLPEFGKDAAGNPVRSLLDVTRVSEDYVSSQTANIAASIARAKGDTVGEAKALEWKAFYDAKINGQPIPPPA